MLKKVVGTGASAYTAIGSDTFNSALVTVGPLCFFMPLVYFLELNLTFRCPLLLIYIKLTLFMTTGISISLSPTNNNKGSVPKMVKEIISVPATPWLSPGLVHSPIPSQNEYEMLINSMQSRGVSL